MAMSPGRLISNEALSAAWALCRDAQAKTVQNKAVCMSERCIGLIHPFVQPTADRCLNKPITMLCARLVNNVVFGRFFYMAVVKNCTILTIK